VTSRPCPCGQPEPFEACCGRYLDDEQVPPTAEALMRSRYTAFHERDAAYLQRTWHPRTRPDDLELDGSLRWLGLDVDEVHVEGDRGTVAFRAHWRSGAERGTLSERSRFERRGARWCYVDGVLDESAHPE
jgi:SEC-C motif domain protein